jgi:ABC-type dipeptide/oligopeptide/nickel transport system permease subunit
VSVTPESAPLSEAVGSVDVTPPGGPGGVEREFTIEAASQSRLVLRRLRSDRLAMASLVIFLLLVFAAFVGQHLWKYDYLYQDADPSVGPSASHPFGTNETGKDVLALVLRGSQRSLEIALFVAVVSTVVGSFYGAISGFYAGRVDNIMMRFVDLILTVPTIAVAAVLSHNFQGTSIGDSWVSVAVVLSALGWAGVSRLVRGVVLSLREKEFVEAAKALGASDWRIITRHLLPNCLGPIIVFGTIAVAGAILAETALSFIGFGVHPPDTSLGLLVSDAQTAANTRPWLFYFPGGFIIIIALTVNFLGDALRDAFDPQQTRIRA